ncbi:MAG: HEAT repeat domain-containing protein [Verrucomicrobia bacterium]|nr:HEAT repeat domain-containing protein [Verrucomicrobiota bacterium]
MQLIKFLVPLILLSTPLLFPNPSQIAYLMQVQQPEKSIALYNRYKNELGKHDFEVLQQMALILLEQGARASDQETQLLSIFGSGIASRAASLDVLEAGIKSTHAETQLASIQFLGRMQDDRTDELLVKAMSSEFFQARLEAAMHLASRKHKTSVGQIESLMYRVPPQARFFFPQFFALIGTSDAISILRHLMEDSTAAVRVEALLCAARFGRDDLLPTIRMNITHSNVAEQEAAAFAVGLLKDSSSIPKLKRLYNSSTSNVQISAARSLLILGDPEAKDFLIQQAKACNPFAIVTLADIPEGKEVLATLCNHPDLAIRINAAISLLKQRDPRCRKTIIEILVRDVRDMGFTPQISLGRTMLALKPVFSATQQPTTFFDIQAATLGIRQQLLVELMHLPEEDFLTIAKMIFESEQADLIPTLVSLLESLQTDGAIALLKTKAQQAGMPLIRAYCNLALFRMGKEGPYEAYLKEWLSRNKDGEMIRFRPVVTIDKRMINSPHELTPEDSSRLLIEVYQTLAERQQESSIDILLDAIANGNIKNRYVLAGLLLRTLQ